MKKRIIATTMASVMALGTASTMIVASAAEADFDKANYVTKADLEKLVKDPWIDDIVDGDIENYGSVSAEKFQKAYDFADAVINDDDATNDDCTTAYLMLREARKNLVQHSLDDLKTLVEMYRGQYETENKLNEFDSIYKEGDWNDFEDAFEEADSLLESTDGLAITDAYEQLDKYKNPEKLEEKTKRQIDAAFNTYIKALDDNEFKYQPWERGTVTDSTAKDYNGLTFAWGVLYAHILSAKDEMMDVYETFTERKGLNKTTNTSIVQAVNTMEQAASVLNSFKTNFARDNSKRSVNKLLTEYNGQLVYTYENDTALAAIKSAYATISQITVDGKKGEMTVDGTDGSVTYKANATDNTTVTNWTAGDHDEYWNLETSKDYEPKPLGDNGTKGTKVKKLLSAEMKIKTSVAISYAVDKTKPLPNGNYAIVGLGAGSDEYFFANEAGVKAATGYSAADHEIKTVNAGGSIVLSDYIQVTSAKIGSTVTIDLDATVNAKGGVKNEYDALVAEVEKIVKYNADGELDTCQMKSDIDAINAIKTAVTSNYTLCEANTADDNAKQTAVVTAANNLIADIEALKAKAAIQGSGTGCTLVATDVSGLSTSALSTAVQTFLAATQASDNGSVKGFVIKSGASAVADIGTLNIVIGDVVNKNTTYESEYGTAEAAAIAAAATETKSNWNSVMDLNTEAKFKTGGTPTKTNKGLLFFADSSTTTSEFEFDTAYSSSRKENPQSVTTVCLAQGVEYYEVFINNPTTTATQSVVTAIDNQNIISANMKKDDNDSKAWRLLYNYLKYALEDQFSASATDTYTKRDVEKKVADAKKLLTDTVDTSLFSTSNAKLRDTVNKASEWLKLAKAAGKDYKDYTWVDTNNQSSTDMGAALKSAYDQLNKEYKGFLYSYGDIVENISKIAEDVDAGKFGASASETLTKDLANVVNKFLDIDDVYDPSKNAVSDSNLFNDDGTMNKNNRLYTNEKDLTLKTGSMDDPKDQAIGEAKGDKPNKAHYEMKTAYEKLLKDYEEAQKAPTDEKNYNVDGKGDAKPDVDDAMALIAFSLKGTYDAQYDYNNDNAVDVDDVMLLIAEALK